LIAVTERLAPNLECYRHGNLLDSIGVATDEATERDVSEEPVLAQHSRTAKRLSLADGALSGSLTRVDVDVRGHRTLVNAMR
jgi:hypothetical protein